MSNYSYISSNVSFNINDDKWVGNGTIVAGNSGNIWANVQLGRQTSVKPFVNAVEIDWNGAQIGES